MSRIVIIDDHELITVSLKQFIEHHSDHKVITTLESGTEALMLIRKEMPDLILLDLNMPDRDGWEVLRDIKAAYPDVKIIIFTINNSPEIIRRIYDLKADGYCHKGEQMENILHIIDRVLSGKKCFPDQIISTSSNFDEYDPSEPPLIKLTNREIQVLQYILRGAHPEEITEIMKISKKTLSTYKRSIYSKLSVETDIQLYNRCRQMEIMDN
jgi:DNA-binding NarL/FixJ family response regulator